MHLAAYVKQLREVVDFLVRKKCLTMEQLAAIWRSQEGSHTAVVANVHSILTEAARNLNEDMIRHLLECFDESWKAATQAQDLRHMEQLLDFVNRLSYEDSTAKTAVSVMELLWTTSCRAETPRGVLEVTLNAHLQLLTSGGVRSVERVGWMRR